MTLPARIGRYRVLDLLGRGAMGIVYRGLDEALDRQVALKVMAGHQADADSRARFKREAQAAAKLQHPNIVTIYELGEHESAPFMALELLDGVDLQRAIEGGLRPDPKVTLPVVLQLLAGLGHAHEHGIVHRDVKPSNLFLPRGRPAKIMDFGVARLAGGMTTAGMVIGTPNYMSPEQVGAKPVDGRSDLFSAGLILYELVTGEKAYSADSVVALLYKIAHEEPDLTLIPKGPRWERLRAVLRRALARDPDERYPDARSMEQELAAALLDLGGTSNWATASDAGLMVRAPKPKAVELGTTAPPLAAPVALGTAPPSEPAPAVPAAAPARSPMALAGALAAAAVVILGFAGYLVTRPAARPAATPAPEAAPTPVPARAQPSPTPAVASARPRAAGPPAAPGARPSPEAESTPPPEPAPEHARVDRANQLLEARRFGSALAEARAVMRRDPTNAEAHEIAQEAEAALLIEECLKRAKAALARGDKDTAVEELKKGLAVNSNEARLLALWREATQ